MAELPTCGLADCNQRPEVRVKSMDWGFPRTRKLCEEHASWAEMAENFEVVEQ